jgi:hypothetical protein
VWAAARSEAEQASKPKRSLKGGLLLCQAGVLRRIIAAAGPEVDNLLVARNIKYNSPDPLPRLDRKA